MEGEHLGVAFLLGHQLLCLVQLDQQEQLTPLGLIEQLDPLVELFQDQILKRLLQLFL